MSVDEVEMDEQDEEAGWRREELELHLPTGGRGGAPLITETRTEKSSAANQETEPDQQIRPQMDGYSGTTKNQRSDPSMGGHQ